MKVIDLLNKIANGEEVPKYIIYNGYRANDKLTYDEETKDYYNEPECSYGLFDDIHYKLNDEVEIIKDKTLEDKKYIEHIKMQENELHNHLNIIDKINEIIDKINGE